MKMRPNYFIVMGYARKLDKISKANPLPHLYTSEPESPFQKFCNHPNKPKRICSYTVTNQNLDTRNYNIFLSYMGTLKFLIRHCIYGSSDTNPCINKAFHVLLMYGFYTINTLVPGTTFYDYWSNYCSCT